MLLSLLVIRRVWEGTMIRAVTVDNQHLYARQLDQMSRTRHAYCIDGHGRGGLTSRDGREPDEFDDAGAVYLMSIDPVGGVVARCDCAQRLAPPC
jgi:N-acyl-L-homoserine lactone synthetase